MFAMIERNHLGTTGSPSACSLPYDVLAPEGAFDVDTPSRPVRQPCPAVALAGRRDARRSGRRPI